MAPILLLADDSVTIQRVIELTFASEGIRVVSTADGQAALRHIASERPDIVLADVGMPKKDGYEVSAHIKKTPALKDIPVLLLTGAFEPIDEARARASGCDGILVKPFEPQQLIARVRELLAGVQAAALSPADLRTAEERFTPPTRPVASVTAKPEPAGGAAAVPSETVAPAPVRAAQRPAGPVPARPGAEGGLQREFDQLDAALAGLEPKAAALNLDEETASDFARDLDRFRSVESPAVSRPFGDWDLPKPPPQPESFPPAEAPAAVSAVREPGASRVARADTSPGATSTPGALEPRAAEPPAPVKPKVSIASAFSALLAAEQAHPAGPPEPTLPETAVLEVVRGVLARMTDETVQRMLLETAERLIKDELEKMKANPT